MESQLQRLTRLWLLRLIRLGATAAVAYTVVLVHPWWVGTVCFMAGVLASVTYDLERK